MIARKTFRVPGIDQDLWEQTLPEYIALLPADHTARTMYNELVAQAMEVPRLTAKIHELEKRIGLGTVVPETTEPAPVERIPCPLCNIPVSPVPGPWAAHMKGKHGLVAPNFPKPGEQMPSPK